ncbi:MAG: DNA-binding protein [Xylophilus ampelinus]
MPNKLIVTMAAVRSAIEAIEARGDSVSVRAVREEIGGGSMTSIAARLRQSRTPIVDRPSATLPSAAFPEAFEDALRDAGAALWSIANEDASLRITAVQKMAETSISALRAERDRLEVELKAANSELAAARSMMKELTTAATQCAFEVASERLTITQAHVKEISYLNDQHEMRVAACLQHQRSEHAREIERLEASHAKALNQLRQSSLEEVSTLRQEIGKLAAKVDEEECLHKAGADSNPD